MPGQPLQIINTGDSEGNKFVLNEENLKSILDKVPPETKVSVVAVVGAFRTGKSFLLNFFLRYLRAEVAEGDESQSWMVHEGNELAEGNMNEGGWSMVENTENRREASFQWRGGEQRQTTGIWMWSEPFLRTSKATGGEKIAVLLMDTQGMFDNETTMTLTAQIFGLSTLVSSFQIYNVDKRIQEDNLQHLALFSEYGRMALLPENEMEEAKNSLNEKMSTRTDAETLAASAAPAEGAPAASEDVATATAGATAESDAPTPAMSRQTSRGMLSRSASRRAARLQEHQHKPFQQLLFLVRDWQNFEKEYDEGDSHEDFVQIQEEMRTYLGEVLRSRNLSDLKSTREQITRCFEKLDCFLLPHPGFAVTKKTYDGSIDKIQPEFRALVNKLVRHVFDEELEAKLINQRPITAPELRTYFEVYVRMFSSSDSTFPKAMTMLDATAEANNRNAFDLALQHYKTALEEVAGKDKPFVKEMDLRKLHDRVNQEAMDIFDDRATMGANDVIDAMRDNLVEQIESEKTRYFTTNALRNPFKDLEFYLLPLAIALVAWIMSVLTDITCSTDFCERVEDTFVNIYFYVLFLLIVLGWNHIMSAVKYLKAIAPELVEHIQQQNSSTVGKKTN